MKSLLFTFLFFFSFCLCYSQNKIRQVKSSPSIKSITKYTFRDEKTKKIGDSALLVNRTFFNIEKHEILWMAFNEKKEINEVGIFFYDSLGHQVKVITYDKNGEKKELKENTYDTLGNKISQTICDKNGKIVNEIKIQYDNEGNPIPIIEIDDKHICRQKSPYIKCKYDGYNNLIEQIHYDEVYKNMIIYKVEYEYEFWE